MLTTTMSSYSLSATYIDQARKLSWKGRRMQFIIAWPDRLQHHRRPRPGAFPDRVPERSAGGNGRPAAVSDHLPHPRQLPHRARTGVVPDDTIALACGADVNLNGLHVVTIAWSEAAASSIDFSFAPFATEGRPAAACEKIVLDGLPTWWDGIRTHPWDQMDDREGTGRVPDLTLIDSGWKDKQWGPSRSTSSPPRPVPAASM